MDKIILAYCRDNADLAEEIDRKLSRVGIPFEHLTNKPGAMPGQFAAWVQSTAEVPIILLVTDNFLKSQNCMASALSMLQQLVKAGRVVPVVADGKIAHSGDGHFESVPTQFERVIHAIQYMNFWQSTYLELRAKRDNATENDPAFSDERLMVVRDISNEIGEFLNLLRDSSYVSWAQFAANDFEVFFLKFGIAEWYPQYRQLAAFDLQPQAWTEATRPQPVYVADDFEPRPARDPEAQPTPQSFENQEDTPEPEPQVAVQKPAVVPEALVAPMPSSPAFSNMDSLIDEIVREEEDDAQAPPTAARAPMQNWLADELDASENEPAAPPFLAENAAPEAEEPALEDIGQTIRDAEFWFEKGHTERALQVLELAAADRPDNPELARAQLLMRARADRNDEAMRQQEAKIFAEKSSAEDFDLLAELALQRGDYLSAKSLWEQAAMLNPNFPGIYLKLARLTDEHFKGQKKMAAEYFRLAADQSPENLEIHQRLATIFLEYLDEPRLAVRYLLNTVSLQNDHPTAWLDLASAYRQIGELDRANTCYRRAVQHDAALKNEVNERLFAAQPSQDAPAEMPRAALATASQQLAPVREILTVLITGATSGIGRATAEIFAQNGHRVILVGRREERLNALTNSFSAAYGNDNFALAFDVRDFRAAQNALENLPEAWQNIDLLLNNAGLARGLDFIHEGDLEHWETMIDTNIKGLLYVTRLVAPGMVRRRRGHIINIGSSAGKEAYPKGNVYCATKFAVEALTRGMRMDLHTHNIRVSQVSPGHVEETEFALTRFDGDAAKAQIYNDFQPLKSRDVAEAIYFIATRPAHVNIQDIWMFGTQQASATMIDRSGRG